MKGKFRGKQITQSNVATEFLLHFFQMLPFLFLKLPYQRTLKQGDISLDNLLGAFIIFSVTIEEKFLLRHYPKKKKQADCFWPTVNFRNRLYNSIYYSGSKKHFFFLLWYLKYNKKDSLKMTEFKIRTIKCI